MKKALTELRQRIRPLPANLLAKALQNADSYGMRLLQYRVAEVCDAAREPDAARTAALHHSAYLWLKYSDDATVVAEERQQAIRAFEAAARPAKPRRPKDLYWTYLAGELRRCAGDTNGAVAWLDEAVRLAGPPGNQFEPASLGRWATEQAEKARRGDTNDSPGTPMHGPEWEEQRRTLLRRLPEMVVALNSGQPPKQWLLEGEGRLKTILVASDLAEEGNADAAAFLFGWLARLADGDLRSRHYQVRRSARILAHHSEAISNKIVAGTKFRVEPLGEAVRYAVRGGPISDSLTRALALKDPISLPAQAYVSAAAARRDKSAKPLLLTRMERGEDYLLADLVKEYFSAVGVFSDIPALERFAGKFGKQPSEGQHVWTRFKCGDIEDAIRVIRMREILGN